MSSSTKQAPEVQTARVYRDEARDRIVIVPPRRWGEADAKATIAELERLVGTRRFHMVADCRGFESYDKEVRQAWQAALGRYKAQIIDVTVVGVQSALVRMGISTVAMITGITMQHALALEGLRDR